AEAFAERSIDVKDAGTDHRVAAEEAELIRGRSDEGGGVEPSRRGTLVGRELRILTGNWIAADQNATAASSDSGGIARYVDREGNPCLQGDYARDLPAAKDVRCDSAGEPVFSGTEG